MAYSYSKLNSENARLLRALIDEETPYTEDTGSRNATILKSIINETEYTEEPQSEIEELLLELKQKIDGGIVAEPLLATENGIYTAEEGKAFTPVTVNVPLPENAVLLKSLTGLPQDVATFNDGADAPLNELKISIEAVQSGSGEPSPTNVRPIAGWSGANIVKYSTLKNLFNINTLKDSTGLDQYTGAEISQASVKSSAWIKAKPNTSYFWNGSARFYFYAEDKSFISRSDLITNSSVTTPSNTAWIRLQGANNSWSTANLQLEEGSSATEYEAYQGLTLNISFGSTVYGGTLDVGSGVLTVTHSYLKITSVDSTGTDAGNIFYRKQLASSQAGVNTSTSNQGLQMSNMLKCYYLHALDSFLITSGGTSIHICLNDQTIDTVDKMNTWLSSNDLYISYLLATPTTIQLSPTQVRSLLGQNNVYADCGKITECEYFAKEGE